VTARGGVRTSLVGALLAALTSVVVLGGATPPAHAAGRPDAAWRVELTRGEWAKLPARVCGGFLPSGYDARDAHTGLRVADTYLWHGTKPARIVGSAYRRAVVASVWCDHEPASGAVLAAYAHGTARAAHPAPMPWPMVKLQAAMNARSRSER
jgi:hypothetical protein